MIEHARGRALRPGERALLEKMLADRFPQPKLSAKLESAEVEDMQDGCMGSIRFVASGGQSRRFGKTIAKADYVDEDGVPVSIAINADDQGELLEVDFWKVDFSRLRRYPAPADLTISAYSRRDGNRDCASRVGLIRRQGFFTSSVPAAESDARYLLRPRRKCGLVHLDKPRHPSLS